MKVIGGILYFPGILTEAQCPDCSRVLQWKATRFRNKVKAECCNKIFTATLNYVGITIESIEPVKEISNGNSEKLEQI